MQYEASGKTVRAENIVGENPRKTFLKESGLRVFAFGTSTFLLLEQ